MLDTFLQNKLKDNLYGTMQALNSISLFNNTIKPLEIIIYVIGGVNYEEIKDISLINSPDVRIIIGGHNIINSKMFIEEINLINSNQA